MSPRAEAALTDADIVCAEDTRVTSKLLSVLGIKRRMVRLDEHAAAAKVAEVVAEAANGANVVLASDAGTPLVSDPGVALVDAAYRAGVALDSVPGPSSVTNALALSGFYAQKFVFLGFLPKKQAGIRAELEPYRVSSMTIVFFDSPHRVSKTLICVQDALGDRRVAVCREMTKLHQEVRRGRLSEAATWTLPGKGEYTIVIEGYRKGVAEDV